MIVLEMILRFGGQIYLSFYNRPQPGSSTDYKILCIGESTTFRQYPQVLESLLNNAYENSKFKVIDAGIPGAGMDFLIDRLPDIIRDNRPDMAIIMAGINENDLFVKRACPSKHFFRLRILKFLKLFRYYSGRPVKPEGSADSASNKSEPEHIYQEAISLANNGELEKSAILLKKLIHTKKLGIRYYLKAAYIYRDFIKNISEATKCAELTLNDPTPDSPENYIEMINAAIFLKDPARIKEVTGKAMHKYPDNPYIISNIVNYYLSTGDTGKAVVLLGATQKEGMPTNIKKLELLASVNYNLGDIEQVKRIKTLIFEYRLQHYNLHTSEMYSNLISILKSNGITPVCMQYPFRRIETLKHLLGNRKDVYYIDNYDVFMHALAEYGANRIFLDYFAGDFGHLTALGNRILAENILNSIKNLIRSD